MAYNFVTKYKCVMGIRRRGIVMFPSPKEYLGDQNFKSHCEAETVVTR